jgi:uncharacterized protein (UPF0332 family)
MKFDWSGYLEIAKDLAKLDSEAAKRNAISRAYYALYGVARRWLVENGHVLSQDRNSHQKDWEFFKLHEDAALFEVGEIGSDLRSSRNKVDYALGELAIPSRQVSQLIDDAEHAIGLLAQKT